MTESRSPKPPVSSSVPYGRRNFIKQSVVSLGVTVQEFVKHRDAPKEKKEIKPPTRTDWLRPPGAVEESLFLERCTGCGDCINACPHHSVQQYQPENHPVIFPDKNPCFLCEDFPCIAACETEALLPLSKPQDVAMGVASVSHQFCTAGQGCNACVSQCPTQALSMDFSGFQLSVAEKDCVGCGICEHVCKTVNDRIAIRVVPLRFLKGEE